MKPVVPAGALDTDSRVAQSIASHKEALANETSLVKTELKMKCYEDSLTAYRSDNFEEALDAFAYYLALVESESQEAVDPEMRATLYSNIAVCLHQLSEWSLAQLYYEIALAIFGTASTPTVAWLYYGDIKQKKVDHINGQLELLRERKQPANSTYIDSNGQRRAFADRDSSWFSTASWVAWYYGNETAAVPAAPAAPAP